MIFTRTHTRTLGKQTNQTKKHTPRCLYVHYEHAECTHSHTHTHLQNSCAFCLFPLTFPLASSTTVGKLWYKNKTRTCTHACTQFFSLFLKTYVHARTRTEHLHFPLLSLFLPPLIFDLTHWHPSPWGREGNGSSPCESSTRRSAAQS